MFDNMPQRDKWKLVDNDENSVNHGNKFNFDFSYIGSEEIKKVVKGYVWRNYKENRNSLNHLYILVSKFKYFNQFAVQNNIYSLKILTNDDVEKFLSFLATQISEKTGEPLSYRYQRGCFKALKSITQWGKIYMPDMVPEKEIFAGNEFTGVNKNRETDFIPDNVLRQINSALKKEENLYIKYGFVILQTTGMRISDMLNLKVDCLEEHPISGWVLSWYNHKSRKHQQNKVPTECAEAVQNLIEETEKYREEADSELEDYIFIYRVSRGVKAGEINNIFSQRYRYWIDNFIEEHNIRGSDGELYNLTPTQFRRTLATDMYSEGRRLLDIKEVLGHSSPQTTGKHYADIKDKERAEVFNEIGIIGDINKVSQEVVKDKETLEWFEKNKDSKARMVDGYCTKPIEEEGKVCDRLKKKRQCFTCKHYIATPEYLEAHKKHLRELQKELKNNEYGKHYADHLKPTIEVLKEIITRLEEVQDAS